MRRIFLAGVIAATPALAQQPYSQSMAECAGLFAFALDHVNRPDRVSRLEAAVDTWMTAAENQADAEGRENPETYVADAMQAKYADWSGRGQLAVLSQEFRDWADYCRSFGRAQGIETDLD